MAQIKIEITNDCLVNHAGLALAVIFFTTKNFKSAIDKVSNKNTKRNKDEFTDYEIIICYLTILCLGKSAFTDINILKQGDYYKEILGLNKIPSERTLGQRLEKMPQAINDCIKQLTVELIKTYAVLTCCLNTEYAPLDTDVSCLDNPNCKKENVSSTYMNTNGFAPIFAYLGGGGFMLDNELRAGSDHSNCAGTDNFILNCLKKARLITDKKILVRLDSGNDSVTNYIAISSQPECYYLVKHNIRRESKEKYYELVEESNCKSISDNTKTIYFYSDYCELKIPGNKNESFKTRRVIRLTKISSDKNGQLYLIPKYELDIWYTSLGDIHLATQVISLYKDHGTSEQFHSEFKSDMNVEQLPSNKFKCNKLIMVMANFVFNVLKIIGQETLSSQKFDRKRPVERIKIKTVLQNIIYHACRFTKRNRQNIIELSSRSIFLEPFCYVFNKFTVAS